jgi:pimeloyl-ACP methyl ester carboxylesterase
VTDRVYAPTWGFNGQTALFAAGLLCTLWAIPKGPLTPRRLMRRRGPDEPRSLRTGEVRSVTRPDGTALRVEVYGPADAQPVVFTHGWGLDSDQWYYAKKELAGYRLIAWDLPGLGMSEKPRNNDYSLESMARDLDAVIGVAGGGRPVVLVGHSIGGMICLTYARLFPEALGSRVCGIVLANTTYTNPLRTTRMAWLMTALQKPLIEPLLHLTILLSPVVRLMNRLSYWNGSTHRSTERTSFSGRETRGQLDFVASYSPRNPPAVLAHGMLGMLGYDASETLRTIRTPVLVVAGDKDPLCKPEASERMRSTIPGATLLTLSPARHQAVLEHHGQFDEAVAAFVSRCGAPSQPRAARAEAETGVAPSPVGV